MFAGVFAYNVETAGIEPAQCFSRKKASTRGQSSATTWGRIYFLQMGNAGPIKIGFSQDEAGIALRLASCQTGNPERLRVVATHPGSRADERDLHERFRSYHLNGEWFLPSPPVVRTMSRWRAAWPEPLRGHGWGDRTVDRWMLWWQKRQGEYDEAAAAEWARAIGDE